MAFAASHSTLADSEQALEAVAREIHSRLGEQPPDVAFVFISQDHAQNSEKIAQLALESLGAKALLGCTGETIVGGETEFESGSAISILAGCLPNAELIPFGVEFERTPDGVICSGVPELEGDLSEVRALLFLGDPYSCEIHALIEQLADDWPGVPVIGGMSSGRGGPGENVLYLNSHRYLAGGVGLLVRGGPKVHSIVSQGCRPIGTPFIVTRAQQNVVFELGGLPAMRRFDDLFRSLSDQDRTLVQRGLHLGLAMDERRDKFDRGDFLISNVIGADQSSGAFAIGNHIRVGQTVQFHVRDSETADEDLRHLLEWKLTQLSHKPAGGLLFSCNGRGTRLFAEPDHDARLLQELCGPFPLAGFFAQGEIGPVGGKNHIHGFTASVALFE